MQKKECIVSNYIPYDKVCMGKNQMLPLIQHVTKVCKIYKDAKYHLNGLSIASDPKDECIKLQKEHVLKKDEIRMYSDNIVYINEV
jgi:hypothetical protein